VKPPVGLICRAFFVSRCSTGIWGGAAAPPYHEMKNAVLPEARPHFEFFGGRPAVTDRRYI